jgi:F-type H+-transporting ATPase subunit a
MPFIVVIERIRNIIRPGTLAVRLRANIIAGHLLLSLLSRAFRVCPLIAVPILAAAELALIRLECAVAFIQSYVFRVLLTLYIAEFSD